MQDSERLNGEAFDDRDLGEALRIDAGDEWDGAEEEAAIENGAIEDVLAEFDDLDQEHEKLAQTLDEAKG